MIDFGFMILARVCLGEKTLRKEIEFFRDMPDCPGQTGLVRAPGRCSGKVKPIPFRHSFPMSVSQGLPDSKGQGLHVYEQAGVTITPALTPIVPTDTLVLHTDELTRLRI